MTTQEIANFIKAQLQLGTTRTEIEKILSLNRITPQEINAAFNSATSEVGTVTPSSPTPTIPPGLTGINLPPKPTPGSATPDRAFPPPTMAMNSIDSVTPAAPTPVTTPPRVVPITPAPPPVSPRPMPPPINVNIPMAPAATPQGSSHWFAWFLFIFILALIATGAYAYVMKPAWAEPFLTPILNLIQPAEPETVIPFTPSMAQTETTDPTAEWQVYRNEKYGFEIKYPANQNFNFTEVTTLLCGDIANEKPGSYAGIVNPDGLLYNGAIFVSGTKDRPTCKFWDVLKSDKFSTSTKTQMTVGQESREASGYVRTQENNQSEYLQIPLNGLVIHYILTQKHDDQIIPISEYNSIRETLVKALSTFKFIAPVATSTSTTSTSTNISTATGSVPVVDLPSLFLPETD